MVRTEKHTTGPAAVPVTGGMAQRLRRIAQQMELDAGDKIVDSSDRAPGFGPVKLGFTREAGSFRRQVSPHGVRDPGE
ncbi:MAG: hypothetical protein ACRDQ4_04805 [Pseudonocardiaceae bacterium]